ncbi:phage tail protein [Methylovulum miyakonense]|uniref:phage tail protein n=1 Tax=Methylovulum miyakonense TaxID=645578 RepID=UPI00036FD63D|nr:phage tail protein [Methylovulum miyakonense]
MKKMGRPTLGGKPLTEAEKKRRQRIKQACYIKAAEGNGFGVHSVLISNDQLLSLVKFWRVDDFRFNVKLDIETEVTNRKITNQAINEVVYYALNMYLDEVKNRLLAEGVPTEMVDMCEDPNRHPVDCKNLSKVEITAKELFKEWENRQLEHQQKESD